MTNWRLLQSLKGRGWTTQALAERIGSCRTHVSQVLGNKPGRGGQTRRKLAKLLTAEELALAGWDENGNLTAEPRSRGEVYGTNTALVRGRGAPCAADAGRTSEPDTQVQARDRTQVERGTNDELTMAGEHSPGLTSFQNGPPQGVPHGTLSQSKQTTPAAATTAEQGTKQP